MHKNYFYIFVPGDLDLLISKLFHHTLVKKSNLPMIYELSTMFKLWVNERGDRQTNIAIAGEIYSSICKMGGDHVWFWIDVNRSTFHEDIQEKRFFTFSFPVTFDVLTSNLLPSYPCPESCLHGTGSFCGFLISSTSQSRYRRTDVMDCFIRLLSEGRSTTHAFQSISDCAEIATTNCRSMSTLWRRRVEACEN